MLIFWPFSAASTGVGAFLAFALFASWGACNSQHDSQFDGTLTAPHPMNQ